MSGASGVGNLGGADVLGAPNLAKMCWKNFFPAHLPPLQFPSPDVLVSVFLFEFQILKQIKIVILASLLAQN